MISAAMWIPATASGSRARGEPVVLLDKKGARRLPFTAAELLSLAEQDAGGEGLRVALIRTGRWAKAMGCCRVCVPKA